MKILQLSQDLLLSIFSYLDLKEVLSVLILSKSLYLKLRNPLFLECLMQHLHNFKLLNLRPSKEEILPFFELIYKKLYLIQSKPPEILSWLPLDASSTDKNQSIYCTLPDLNGFWGSTAVASEEGEQFLIYDLGESFTSCFIRDIIVRFTHFNYVYRDGHTIGNPLFQSKYIQVELSFIPSKPCFKSELVPVSESINMGEELNVNVPVYPNIVFARYVRIRFVGMRSRHTLKDNQFYLCVDEVTPIGHYSTNLDSSLLNTVIQNNYLEKVENFEDEKDIDDITTVYVKDSKLYIQELINKLQEFSKKGDSKSIVDVFERNPQLKTSKEFMSYLAERMDVADLYLDNLAKKQMHLNLLETILVLNLSIDWEKMNPFENSSFLKEGKYFGMFWLFYFDSYKLEKYIQDSYSNPVEAYANVEEDNVEGVSQLELHGALELKRIILEGAIKHFITNGNV